MSVVRIRGERLDVDSAYVDVVLDSYTIDNDVTLIEQTNDNARTWTVDATTLQSWRANNDLVPLDEIDDPSATLWTIIEEVHQLAARKNTPPEAGDVGRQAAADLFHASANARDRGQGRP